MRLRDHAVTLAIVAAAVAVGVKVFVVDRDTVTTAESARRKRNLLEAFRKSALTRIEIEKNGAKLALELRGDDAGEGMWWLRAGERDELADQSAVERLTGSLEFASYDRKLGADFDRAAAGLDRPALRMTVVMGRLSYTLAFGAAAPAPAGARYAALNDGTIVVVPRDVVAELDQGEGAFRTRTLVPYFSPDLARIEIEGEGGTRKLARGAFGGFAVEGEPAARVDRDVFDRVLEAFSGVRAEASTFLAADEAERALAAPRVKLTLVPSDASRPRGVVEVGGACPSRADAVVAIRREPSLAAACVPKGVMAALATPAEALRDLHAVTLHPDEIQAIEIVAGDSRLDLARREAVWRLRAPTSADVDGEAGNALARAIAELAGARLVASTDLAALGLAPPAGTLRVERVGTSEHDGGAPSDEVVDVGRRVGDVVHLRRRQDGAVLEVSAEAARVLAPSAVALRARKLPPVAEAAIRGVVLAVGDVRQVARRSDVGRWTLDAPRGYPVDLGVVGDAASTLATLAVERWVAESDDGSFGLAAPRARLELSWETADAGLATRTLVVGSPTEGGAYARIDGDPGVFVVGKAAVRRCSALAVDRSSTMFGRDEVVRVRLRAGAATVELAKSGDSLRVVRGPSSIGPTQIEAVRDALAESRAEAAVHLGPSRKEDGLDVPRLVVELELEGASGRSTAKIAIGAGDVFDGTSTFYVRRDGVDATFAVAQSKLRPLLDLF